MSETKEEERLSGRLEDLASNPAHLNEYLVVRVDILGEEEKGTILGHGDDLQEMKDIVRDDSKADKPGAEYHIFYPQKSGGTSREISSTFMTGGSKFRSK